MLGGRVQNQSTWKYDLAAEMGREDEKSGFYSTYMEKNNFLKSQNILFNGSPKFNNREEAELSSQSEDFLKSLTSLLVVDGDKKVKKQRKKKKCFSHFSISFTNAKQSTKKAFAKILFNYPGVWWERVFHNL